MLKPTKGGLLPRIDFQMVRVDLVISSTVRLAAYNPIQYASERGQSSHRAPLAVLLQLAVAVTPHCLSDRRTEEPDGKTPRPTR